MSPTDTSSIRTALVALGASPGLTSVLGDDVIADLGSQVKARSLAPQDVPDALLLSFTPPDGVFNLDQAKDRLDMFDRCLDAAQQAYEREVGNLKSIMGRVGDHDPRVTQSAARLEVCAADVQRWRRRIDAARLDVQYLINPWHYRQVASEAGTSDKLVTLARFADPNYRGVMP